VSENSHKVENQKRGKSLEWIFVNEYSSEDALVTLQLESNWVTQDGQKEYYQCNISKNCEATLQLFTVSETEKVLIFTSKEHKHDVIEEKRGIDPATKVEIEILYKIGISKPKAILAALEQKNVPIPSYIQMANYLAQLKNRILGKSSISLGELEDWAKKNLDIPEDDDTPFVCGFECSFESKWFRLALTTK